MGDAGRSYDAVLTSPVGCLGIRTRGVALVSLSYLRQPVVCPTIPSASARSIGAQLRAYFIDPGYRFSMPLSLVGSSFQQTLWEALRELAPGTTITYGALARRFRTAPRAIGGACRANPIPIVIPCHRVVSAAGLGGYTGGTERALEIKRWLLAHEARH